jgi:ketosteroid isomerase-like protein
MSGFEDVEIRDFRLLPAGDRVVALLHTRARGERDDLTIEQRDAHTITFRDGKIAYWRLYLDQGEALSDAGLDPELASAPTP